MQFVGKLLVVVGAILFIAECDTLKVAVVKTLSAIICCGAGYLLARKDFENADNRA